MRIAGRDLTTKRLFFALWPDDAIRRQCREVTKAIYGPGLRFVEASNLHVTLVFLGGVDAEQESKITAAADKIVPPPAMSMTFDRLSFWKKPAIYCLTSCSFDPSIGELAEALSEIAVQNGIRVDERAFKPHATLVRKARKPVEIEFEPIVWRADSFCLVESHSGRDGTEYRVIKRWPSR